MKGAGNRKGSNPKAFPMSNPTPKGKAGDPVSKGTKTRTSPTMRLDHGPGMKRGR